MKSVLMAGVALCAGGGLAAAQQAAPLAAVALKPDQVIAMRQAGMLLMYGSVPGLKLVLKQRASVKPFERTAKAIANYGRVIPTLFPDGTQTGHDTKAKPDIWSDRAGFEKHASALTAAADKLAAAAHADDKAAFAREFKAVGKACSACHHQYEQQE